MELKKIEQEIDEANAIYKKGMRLIKEDEYEDAIGFLTEARDIYEDLYNAVEKQNPSYKKILRTIDEIIEECDEMIEECKYYVDYKKENFVSDVKDFYGDEYDR